MKKYVSFFRMKYLNGLQYRAAAYAGVATQFAWGFMELLMFSAFYRADPAAIPMPAQQLSSYIWLQQAFLALFMTWIFDNEIYNSASSGTVAYELCRPLDVYSMWFVRTAAERVSRAVLRCLPILAVAVFLPPPFRMGPPAGVPAFVLFLVSSALALLLVVAFCMLVYISAFYTLSPMGVRMVVMPITDLLTGAIIPLPFFPEPVRGFVQLLPFAYMQNVPLRIYGGGIAGAEAIRDIALQLFWLAALALGGRIWMGRALRRVVAQGG